MPTVLVVDVGVEMARVLATNRVVALEKTMRVLVIDDDVAYRMACTAVIAEDGHDVVPCGSVDEGTCWLSRSAFDVLMADARLVAADAAHLMTLARPAAITIAMSAILDSRLCRTVTAAGARFVVKPTDAASLSALLMP